MSFADMMTLLFCLFMVLFAISSVNTSKFEALQRSLQDAFSGAVLSGGKSMMASGSSAEEHQAGDRRAAAAVDAPADAINDTSAKTDAEKAKKAAAGGAGLPRAQAPDRQALRGRRPAGQGQRHDPPSRAGHPAADGQGLLRFRRRDAEAVRAQARGQDRRCRARRAQAPGRRRGPHGLAADRRSPVPVQLGALRRSRRGGRPRLPGQRRARAPDVRRRLRQPGTDRNQLDVRRTREEPPGRGRPHPPITPTGSHNPGAWRRHTPWSRNSFPSSSRSSRSVAPTNSSSPSRRPRPRRSPRSTARSTCSRRSSSSTCTTGASRSSRSA